MMCIKKGIMRLCNERQMSPMIKFLNGCNGCRYKIRDDNDDE